MNKLLRFFFTMALMASIGCKQQPTKTEVATKKTAIKKSPRLMVFDPDTPQEEKALTDPFKGVTTQGKIVPGLFTIKETGVSTNGIQNAVAHFLESLSEEQKALCLFDVDAQEWRRWSNIDSYTRKGIGLPNLTEKQKALAFDILKESLSPSGFKKTQNIMKMEGYLARLANDFEALGPDHYWFTFMGRPSDNEPWGWQIDGHHLIINYFILGDQVVMTPTFMGSEPNYIVDGENAGTRTFKEEEDKGYAFYTSLSDDQRALATAADQKAYNYNQAESYSDNAVVPYAGINTKALNEDQQLLLESLIMEYIGVMGAGHARIKRAEVMDHWNDTYFVWAGGSTTESPFYYRVHSPVIMIEFDHQKPIFLDGDKPTKKHVHTVVRTPNGNDYGKDLLKQHLKEHHHE